MRRALVILATPIGARAGAVACGFAALLVAALAPVMPTPPSPEAPLAAADQASPEQTRPATYPAIDAHPLFLESRLPWTPPPPVTPVATVAPPPALQPPRYVLAGMVISDGVRVAVLRSGQKTVSVAEGGQLEGWTLREVRPSGLRFEADGAVFDLTYPKPAH